MNADVLTELKLLVQAQIKIIDHIERILQMIELQVQEENLFLIVDDEQVVGGTD